MTKSDLVRKYITDNPTFSKKGLSALIFKNHPDLFKSVEDARCSVRYVTGALGASAAIKDPEKVKFFYNGFEKWTNQNLNTELRPWDEPYQIPKGIKRLNIIADLHSVNLNPKVMTAFLKRTSDKEAVLINGDLMDSESLSRHLKGHNVIAYEQELEICHQLLKGLKQEFTHVYFKQGNHDFWLERYLLINARDVFKVLGLELFSLLRCAELGVHTIHNLAYVKFGDLDIVHGHEFNAMGSKFPATPLLDKWQRFKHAYDVKVLQAHSHINDHTIGKKSKDGKFGEAWSIPAMCRKAAGYNPYGGWDNGWAVAINIDGETTVKTIVYDS